MKHLSKLLALLLIAGALVACGGDSTEVPDPKPGPSEQPEEKPDPEKPDANDNIQFPDAKFAAYMVENFDTDGDGGISPKEAAQITKIECPGMEIESLEGIEYCTELTYLNCGYNNNKFNKLATIDISKNTKLTDLRCGNNQLATLDVSKNTELTYLNCSFNQLTAFDVSKNTALTKLHCFGNQLISLDVSKNTKLTDLGCAYNQLTTLDVSGCTELTFLDCRDNRLASLDASRTNLVNYQYGCPLWCKMASLEILYLKTGWELKGINNPRDAYYIHPNTQIEYKD